MPTRLISLLCGGLLLVSAASAAAADPFKVSIRVEGKSRTLVPERRVTVADGPIFKDGNPDHSCNGQSALGALHAGTGGDWGGSYSEGLGYFVDTIKGEKPGGSDFFQLWVNHRESTVGFCDAVMQPNDEVLVLRQSCTYDPETEQCPDEVLPLGIRVAKKIERGRVRTVKVVAYRPNGRARAERGAVVFVNGKRLGRTNRKGRIKVRGTKAGVAKIYAKDKGRVRSETVAVRIVR